MATYHFSSTEGDDNRTAVQAQSENTPWKSISKLNSVLSSASAGDNFLFKKGDRFEGTITLSKAGTSSARITIGNYGQEQSAKPLLTSLKRVSNWVNAGNGIWESTDPAYPSYINMVLFNRNIKEKGNWPGRGNGMQGIYNITDNVSGKNQITASTLSGMPNLVGAEVVLRTNYYVIDRLPITGHSGNTLTLGGAASYTLKPGYGYFIQNAKFCLTQLGDWCYNASTKTISMFFGSASPSSHDIQVAMNDHIIQKGWGNSSAFVDMKGLGISGSNNHGVTLLGGSNFRLLDTDMDFVGVNGAFVQGASDVSIERVTLNQAAADGFIFHNDTFRARVIDTDITNIGVIEGHHANGVAGGYGVSISSDDSLVQYTHVKNVGYLGIRVEGDNSQVINNYVDTFCTLKTDGSGIYTWEGSTNRTNAGLDITKNIVINGVGNVDGIPDSNAHVEGIYSDDNQNGFRITDNIVIGVPNKGIYLHNNRNFVVSGNLLFNCKAGLNTTHDTLGHPITGAEITDNIVISKKKDQLGGTFVSIKDDLFNMGTIDRNIYSRPMDNVKVIQWRNNNGNVINHSVAEWSTVSPYDKNSSNGQFVLSPYTITKEIGNNKYPNEGFNSSNSNFYTNQSTAIWDANSPLDGGAPKITATGNFFSTFSHLGQIVSGKKYVARFSIVASKVASFSAVLMNFESPYNNVSEEISFGVTDQRLEVEIIFNAHTTVNQSAFRILCNSNPGNIEYWLDNLVIKEVEATETNPDDWFFVDINPSKQVKTISLQEEYKDVTGKIYSKGNHQIEPYGALILMRTGNTVEEPDPDDGKTVYVEPGTGTGSGTAASPFKSVAELNAKLATGVPAGNSVKFAAGSRLDGMVSVPTVNDGTEGNEIVFTSFGTGAKPVISGSRRVTSWAASSKGANIYEFHNSSLPADIPGISMDGVPVDRGRLPATGMAYFQSSSGTSSITSDQIPNVNYATGEVGIVVDKNPWIRDRGRVTGRSGNTLSYTGTSSYSAGGSRGFFIDNAIEALKKDGDWMYSPSEKKIYLYSTSNPNNRDVRYYLDSYNINQDGASRNVFDGLRLEHSREVGLRSHVSSNGAYRNLEIVNHAGLGLETLTSVNVVVENSLFENCLVGGLYLRNASENATVTGNTFRNIGMKTGYSGNGDGKANAIHAVSQRLTARFNRFENIGYLPINFFGNDVLIENNVIDRYCQDKHDGGGLYCYGARKDSSTFSNRILRSNIIRNGGSDQLSAAFGVYIDDNSEGILVEYNTIVDVWNSAYYNHNSHGINFENNLIFGCYRGFHFGQNKDQDGNDNEFIRDNRYFNNTVVLKGTDSLIGSYSSEGNDLNLFCNLDHNHYIVVSGKQAIYHTRHKVNGRLFYNNYTIEQFRSSFNQEHNSKVTYLNVPEYTVLSEGPNRVTSMSSSPYYEGGTATTTTGTGEYPSFYRVRETSPSPVTTRMEKGYSGIGPILNDKTYRVRFKAVAPQGRQSLVIYIRETKTPYRRLSRESFAVVSDQVQEFEFFFTGLREAAEASLLTECQGHLGDLYITDVEFREVTVEKTDIDQYVKLVVNDTEDAVSEQVSGSFETSDGVPVEGSIEVAPFSSVLLLGEGNIPEPPKEYNISVTVSPSNAGVSGVSSPFPYREGDTITMMAQASAGFTFKHYELELSPGTIGTVGVGNPSFTFTMPGNNVNIRAVFEGQAPPVDPPVDPPSGDFITVRTRFVFV